MGEDTHDHCTDDADLSGLVHTFVQAGIPGAARASPGPLPSTPISQRHGTRALGRDVIAQGHNEILATVFRGTADAAINQIRYLRPCRPRRRHLYAPGRRQSAVCDVPAGSRQLGRGNQGFGVWAIAVLRNMIPSRARPPGALERSLAGVARACA